MPHASAAAMHTILEVTSTAQCNAVLVASPLELIDRQDTEKSMKIVDLSMTLSDWDKNVFAPEETYFKLRPIVKWEDKGFVSNMVEMTVHAGTHIDSPHHFYRDLPSIEKIPIESFVGE